MTYPQSQPQSELGSKGRYTDRTGSSAQNVSSNGPPQGSSGPNSQWQGQQGPSSNSTGPSSQISASNSVAPVQILKPQNKVAPSPTWVLLCLKNGSSLPHEQIEIPKGMSDNEFFRKFRLEYRRLRGWSYWYHPDKFYFCHVAKFVKWDVRQMGYHCNQMPACSSYIFQPKPPSIPYELPVPAREWECRFHRDCSYSAAGFLSHIPKRTARYELGTCKNREEVWGLYVVYRTSLRIVLVWFSICLSPSLIFIGLWLSSYKTDLQGASVPLFATMAAISALHIFLGGRFKGEVAPD